MKQLYNKQGFTVIEMTIAMLISLMGLTCIVMLTIFGLSSYNSITGQTGVDLDAVKAMNRMIDDIRESKTVTLLSTSRMQGNFPIITADGRYDRSTADPNGIYEYYLSDTAGNPSATGTEIWVKNTNSTKRRLVSNVEALSFASFTTRSIEITITTKVVQHSKTLRCNLTQRVVYLRNY